MGAALLPLAIGGAGIAGGQYMKYKAEQDALKQASATGNTVTQMMGNIGGAAHGANNPFGMKTTALAPRDAVMTAAARSPQIAQTVLPQILQEAFQKPAGPKVYKPGDIIADDQGNVVKQFPQATEAYKVGQTRDFQVGTNKVYQEWDGSKWVTLGSGPAYKPDAPTPTEDPMKQVRTWEDNLRKELEPQTKLLQQTRSDVQTLNKYLDTKTDKGTTSPLAVTYAVKTLERANEPGAIVRESDVALINQAQSLLQQLNAKAQQFKNGIPVSDPLLQQIRSVANALLESRTQSYAETVQTYEPIIRDRKLRMDMVAPGLSLPQGEGRLLRYNPTTGMLE